MQYYKILVDDIVASINTLNADGNGNITEEEYNNLFDIIRAKPDGKQIRDNGDGTYSYEDAPPLPEPDLTADEIVDIIFGGVS